MRVQLYADTAGAVAMLTATWVMTRFVDRRRFQTIGFAPDNTQRDLAAGLALGVGWIAVSVGGAWAAGWKRWDRRVRRLQEPVRAAFAVELNLHDYSVFIEEAERAYRDIKQQYERGTQETP
jgi:hypothetical protein